MAYEGWAPGRGLKSSCGRVERAAEIRQRNNLLHLEQIQAVEKSGCEMT